jgi:hypothetical protein
VGAESEVEPVKPTGQDPTRRALSLLLVLGGLSGCMGPTGLLSTPRAPSRKILQSPQIESAAEQIFHAEHDAVVARTAPDARQQWLIPPAVSGNGNWEASALCFALASRNGRLRPLEPPGQVDTVAAIQAWLRATSSEAVVWMVESSGMFRPELDLVVCSASRSWRSESFTIEVAKELRFAWPLDPDENPPLATLSVGTARSLLQDGSEVYLHDREGSRRVEWHRRSSQLKLGKLRPSGTPRENRFPSARGPAQDSTPPLLIMRRDLRLVLSDADLPEGEGEFEQWSLSRGGEGMELPLSRASETQIVSIMASPGSWNESNTWLVLRRNPTGEAELQLFAAALRELPEPPPLGPAQPEETLRIATDLTWPLLLDGLGKELSVTHELRWNRAYHAPNWEEFAEFTPRFAGRATLSFWTLDWRSLGDLRLRHLDPPMHVVRFSPLAKELPIWSAAVAKKPLVLGDTARWRMVPAAAVWGIARLSPSMPEDERCAAAAWLGSLGPFELFGLDRNDLSPRLPLSGRERPRLDAEGGSLSGLALAFSFTGCPGIVDRLPDALRGELQGRLGFLARDQGATLLAARATAPQNAPGSGTAPARNCVLAGEHRIDFGRLVLPKGTKRERATALLRACGLLEEWQAEAARHAPNPATLSDDAMAVEIENWLLRQSIFVPLWSEEGRVFVDRRVAGLRVDSQGILPDLSEAHLLPQEQVERFGLQP